MKRAAYLLFCLCGAAVAPAFASDELTIYELLDSIRDLLLEQHKLLLDRERASYEKLKGPIPGPGPF